MTVLCRVLLPAICLVAVCPDAKAAEPRQPQIVAHRGLLRHAPENTLANFRACLELRLGFEFDVQRTKDGQLVCIHDDTVDRTTNGTGKVSDLTLEQIKQFDAGSWFDSKFAGERVPTIEEVLKLATEYRHDVLLAADLKAKDVGQDVVRLAEKYQVLDRLLFIGTTISQPHVRDQISELPWTRTPPRSPTAPMNFPRHSQLPTPIGSTSVSFPRRNRSKRCIGLRNGRLLRGQRSAAICPITGDEPPKRVSMRS